MITSLIISTYNWKEALDVCLSSVSKQIVMPSEILVADDGSDEDTKVVIDKWRNLISVPVCHVWQEDLGFRVSEIRNKAIAVAKGDYIIQVDGDQILHRSFISDHIRFAKRGTFVSGGRVLLGEQISAKLLKGTINSVSIYMKDTTNFLNGLHIPLLFGILEMHKADDPFCLRGCNMAFWREDLIAVNGYNREIQGWGREDSELGARLINAGCVKRIIKFGAIVYHIYHAERSRNKLDQNNLILQKSIDQKLTRCENGIK